MATANLKKRKEDMTLNDWAGILCRAGKKLPDKVPPGWETVLEIAENIGRSASYTARILNQAVADGVVETQSFMVQRRVKLQSVPHYRTIKTA